MDVRRNRGQKRPLLHLETASLLAAFLAAVKLVLFLLPFEMQIIEARRVVMAATDVVSFAGVGIIEVVIGFLSLVFLVAVVASQLVQYVRLSKSKFWAWTWLALAFPAFCCMLWPAFDGIDAELSGEFVAAG